MEVKLEFHLKKCKKAKLDVMTKIDDAKVKNICPICSWEAKTKQGLNLHEKTCQKLQPYVSDLTCKVCHRSFGAKKSLFIHIRMHLRQNQNPEETKDPEPLEDPELAKDQRVTVNDLDQEDDDIPDLSDLDEEMPSLQKPKSCQYCQTLIPDTDTNVDSHVKFCKHLQSFAYGLSCKFCNQPFKTLQSLFEHLHQIHNPDDLFKCKACSYESRTETQLKFHLISCDSEDQEALERSCTNIKEDPGATDPISMAVNYCVFCESFVKDAKGFAKHVQACRITATYISTKTCNFCDKEFGTTPQVFEHVKTAHGHSLNQLNKEITIKECPEGSDSESDPSEFQSLEVQCTTVATIKSEPSSSSLQDSDPRMVTILFICPLCLGKFTDLKVVQDHVVKFHKVTLEHQIRLGLKIVEEIL